jgi:hypothetical protein
MPARDDIPSDRPQLQNLKLLPQGNEPSMPGAPGVSSRAQVLAHFAQLFGQH